MENNSSNKISTQISQRAYDTFLLGLKTSIFSVLWSHALVLLEPKGHIWKQNEKLHRAANPLAFNFRLFGFLFWVMNWLWGSYTVTILCLWTTDFVSLKSKYLCYLLGVVGNYVVTIETKVGAQKWAFSETASHPLNSMGFCNNSNGSRTCFNSGLRRNGRLSAFLHTRLSRNVLACVVMSGSRRETRDSSQLLSVGTRNAHPYTHTHVAQEESIHVTGLRAISRSTHSQILVLHEA